MLFEYLERHGIEVSQDQIDEDFYRHLNQARLEMK
jgi:hypothetical protein